MTPSSITVPLGEGAAQVPQPTLSGGVPTGAGTGTGTGTGSRMVNTSLCIKQRCVCAPGRLGARCAYTSDQLVLAARARAHREHNRVRGLHLCLSAWRGGGMSDTTEATRSVATSEGAEETSRALRDGTPLAFALCRRRQNKHQRWDVDGDGRHGMRIRSEGDRGLCVTVPPVDLA